MSSKIDLKKLGGFFQKYKLIFLVLAVGILLLLWPSGGEEPTASSGQSASQNLTFDMEALEDKLEHILSRISGAGQVAVALTAEHGVENIYAADISSAQDDSAWEETRETVIISAGSGVEQAVLVQQRYPTFLGAVVVCDGGADPEVRLLITQAVSDLTGLGTDRILVCKSK